MKETMTLMSVPERAKLWELGGNKEGYKAPKELYGWNTVGADGNAKTWESPRAEVSRGVPEEEQE